MKKHILAGLLVLLVGVLMAVPAAAQPYPPTFDGVAVSTDILAPGAPLAVTGDGWLAGSEVHLELHSDPVHLGTAQVAADGTFSTSVTIPASVPAGDHTLVVTGSDADGQPRVEETAVTVAVGSSGADSGAAAPTGGSTGGAADTTTPGEALAYTGMDFTVGTTALVVLLIAGAATFLIGRRKSARAGA